MFAVFILAVANAHAKTCVNALAGIADPVAWVKAAREVERLTVADSFPIALANAVLDMKDAEGET